MHVPVLPSVTARLLDLPVGVDVAERRQAAERRGVLGAVDDRALEVVEVVDLREDLYPFEVGLESRAEVVDDLAGVGGAPVVGRVVAVQGKFGVAAVLVRHRRRHDPVAARDAERRVALRGHQRWGATRQAVESGRLDRARQAAHLHDVLRRVRAVVETVARDRDQLVPSERALLHRARQGRRCHRDLRAAAKIGEALSRHEHCQVVRAYRHVREVGDDLVAERGSAHHLIPSDVPTHQLHHYRIGCLVNTRVRQGGGYRSGRLLRAAVSRGDHRGRRRACVVKPKVAARDSPICSLLASKEVVHSRIS